MNIWIFNHYAVGPGASGGTRHYDLAKELGKRGDRVTLFASSFEHQSRQERKFTAGVQGRVLEESIGAVQFVWIKTRAYTQNDWRRVVNMIGYTFRAFWAGLRKTERPDVIIGSLMHPLAALIGWLLAWIKGSLFYFEERDLWPQTLIDLGKVSEHHPVVWLLRRLEHFLYRRAKRIIVLFDKAVDYVESQGFSREKVLYVPNGVDLQRFTGEKVMLSSELEAFFRQRNGAFVAAYVGSHGISDRLDAVLETAALLKAQGERFHFLLIGDGPEKARLLRVKEEMELVNVTFLPPVPKEMIPAILVRCQVGLMCLPDAELYKWGISFNKMYDYMAAALPIVLLSRYGESQLERSGGGYIVDSPARMSEILAHLADEQEEAQAVGQRGYRYVSASHTWGRLSEKIAEVMRTDVAKRQISNATNRDAKPAHVVQRKWYFFWKRVFDVITASFALLLLSPLMLVVALLVRVKLGRPVLFRQQRPGRYGVPFWIYKFRSMSDQRDANGNLLPDRERLTAFGKWLRKYSLDEMPQLLNVLRGELSLVGPRPLLMSYLPRYNDEQKRRHDVLPGITGWAQVNGRNAIGWEEKFKLDVWYVDHASFWLDLKILWLSVSKVVRSEGISMQGEATMSEFMGSKDYEPAAQGVVK